MNESINKMYNYMAHGNQVRCSVSIWQHFLCKHSTPQINRDNKQQQQSKVINIKHLYKKQKHKNITATDSKMNRDNKREPLIAWNASVGVLDFCVRSSPLWESTLVSAEFAGS